MSIRIDENGAKTKKLWRKQDLNLKWAWAKKPRGLNKIKPVSQGLAYKTRGTGWRVVNLENSVDKTKGNCCFAIIFELGWTMG